MSKQEQRFQIISLIYKHHAIFQKRTSMKIQAWAESNPIDAVRLFIISILDKDKLSSPDEMIEDIKLYSGVPNNLKWRKAHLQRGKGSGLRIKGFLNVFVQHQDFLNELSEEQMKEVRRKIIPVIRLYTEVLENKNIFFYAKFTHVKFSI